jgi:hypothetical protein
MGRNSGARCVTIGYAPPRPLAAQLQVYVKQFGGHQRWTVRRTRGGQAVSKYPEVIGLAGAMILESRRPHYRHSQVRVKRAPNNRGWVACNDGPDFATQIAHWLALSGVVLT